MKKKRKEDLHSFERGRGPSSLKIRSIVCYIDRRYKVFSVQRQTGGSGRKSSRSSTPALPPPQATNYRATLAERFNTRFGGGGGEGGGVPNVTTRLNPAISPTDRGPANFMVTNGDE